MHTSSKHISTLLIRVSCEAACNNTRKTPHTHIHTHTYVYTHTYQNHTAPPSARSRFPSERTPHITSSSRTTQNQPNQPLAVRFLVESRLESSEWQRKRALETRNCLESLPLGSLASGVISENHQSQTKLVCSRAELCSKPEIFSVRCTVIRTFSDKHPFFIGIPVTGKRKKKHERGDTRRCPLGTAGPNGLSNNAQKSAGCEQR